MAFYKRSREVEQHQLVVRTGFEPGNHGFQIQRSNHSATLAPFYQLKWQEACLEEKLPLTSAVCSKWRRESHSILPILHS